MVLLPFACTTHLQHGSGKLHSNAVRLAVHCHLKLPVAVASTTSLAAVLRTFQLQAPDSGRIRVCMAASGNGDADLGRSFIQCLHLYITSHLTAMSLDSVSEVVWADDGSHSFRVQSSSSLLSTSQARQGRLRKIVLHLRAHKHHQADSILLDDDEVGDVSSSLDPSNDDLEEAIETLVKRLIRQVLANKFPLIFDCRAIAAAHNDAVFARSIASSLTSLQTTYDRTRRSKWRHMSDEIKASLQELDGKPLKLSAANSAQPLGEDYEATTQDCIQQAVIELGLTRRSFKLLKLVEVAQRQSSETSESMLLGDPDEDGMDR